MSYTTDTRSSPATIAAVVTIHVAIGYAFISGLAMTVIKEIPVVTLARFIPDQAPPPPNMPPPEPRTAVEPTPTVPVQTIVDLPPLGQQLTAIPLPQFQVTPVPSVEPRPLPVPPPAQSLAREAAPRGDRAAWVTPEDYPPSALREEVEGVTAVRVAIGLDGRVTNCVVTVSSGNALLDQATCRTYARRARFSPALDEAGRPVATSRSDRVAWRIPR